MILKSALETSNPPPYTGPVLGSGVEGEEGKP